ncbi:hypothetical protein DL96DRAFT_1706966 [Flagelloscypha sp. PMI_526]|nr:hypothetical protein DL96DRAFT_1706966 [Flagelloscypha sp. PMI_526]
MSSRPQRSSKKDYHALEMGNFDGDDEAPETREDDTTEFSDGDESGHFSGYEDVSPRKKRKRKEIVHRKGQQLPCVAEIVELANDTASSDDGQSRVDAADASVVARIRKALHLAQHSGTGEHEARNAMRMATALMNNVQTVLVKVFVELRSPRGALVRQFQWHDTAMHACDEAFNVRSYTELTVSDSLRVVFYGLADNTAAAAMAFEMFHNQTLTWTMERQRAKELKGQVAANNYKNGRLAVEEEKKRLKQAEQEENAKREAEVARLERPPAATEQKKVKVEEVHDDDGPNSRIVDTGTTKKWDIDCEGVIVFPPPTETLMLVEGEDSDEEVLPDFRDDDELDMMDLDALEEKAKVKPESAELLLPARNPSPMPLNPEEPLVKPEPTEETMPSWQSALQLSTFRKNAEQIAENFLKDKGMKLSMRRKSKPTQYDYVAYNKGWDDGKKVDLKRRRIED